MCRIVHMLVTLKMKKRKELKFISIFTCFKYLYKKTGPEIFSERVSDCTLLFLILVIQPFV